MFPSLSPDNLTTIIVALLAFASAFFTAKIGVKKGTTDTLGRMKMENETLKGKLKEIEGGYEKRIADLEKDLAEQRNKTALEMRHKIEAQAELEAIKRATRRKRRRS